MTDRPPVMVSTGPTAPAPVRAARTRPEGTEWVDEIGGYRWRRRRGDRGVVVIRLRPKRGRRVTWSAKLHHLSPDRRPVGDPDLLGMFPTESGAKFAADVTLGTEPGGQTR
jgi:hypothetical protein